MLTLEDIIRVARLQMTYGERRPGFITHNDLNLKGPSSVTCRNGELSQPQTPDAVPGVEGKRAARRTVRIKSSVRQDPETGEYRLMADDD